MEESILKVFFSLMAVAGVLYGVLLLLRRAGAMGLLRGERPHFRVLGTMTLAPKQAVSVIVVGERVLVVGMSENGMRTLTEITNKEEAAALKEQFLQERAREEAHSPSNIDAAPPTLVQFFASMFRKKS